MFNQLSTKREPHEEQELWLGCESHNVRYGAHRTGTQRAAYAFEVPPTLDKLCVGCSAVRSRARPVSCRAVALVHTYAGVGATAPLG